MFLSGEAGEGKTSFLRQLMWHAADTHRVFLLKYLATLPSALTQSPRDAIRSLCLPINGKSTPVLLVCDIGAPPVGEQEAALVGFLTDILSEDYESDHLTVVLAGRPPWVNPIRRKTVANSEIVELAGLNPSELSNLQSMIRRAYADLSATEDRVELEAQYPNLQQFTSRSTPINIHDRSTSMLVTFLEAVYGDQFYLRLVEECTAMSPADQKAYIQVCLATIANGDIPERILSVLCENADLDSRSRLDPWTRDTNNNHLARHAVIAQTVIEESGLNAQIRACLKTLLQNASTSGEIDQIFFGTLEAIGFWEPIAVTGKPALSPNQLRKIAREVLFDGSAAFAMTSFSSAADPHKLIRYSRILNTLLPEDPGGGKENVYLLDQSSQALRRASHFARNEPFMLETLSYYLTKADYLRSKISGESLISSREIVKRWKVFLGHEWCGSDFYADFLGHSIAARSELLDVHATRHEAELFDLYRAAEMAYQYIYSAGGKLKPGLLARYMSLRVRRIYSDLSPESMRAVFETGWQLSVQLGHPDGGVGIQLDQELARVGNETKEHRIDLLHVIIGSALHSKHQAALRLANLVRGEDEKRQAALDAVRAINRPNLSEHASALVSHSIAILLDPNDPQQVEELRQACKGYKGSVRDRDGWLEWETHWRQAARQLLRLDAVAGQEALEDWRQTRTRLGN